MSLGSLYKGTMKVEGWMRVEGWPQPVRVPRWPASSFPVGNPCAGCLQNPETNSSPLNSRGHVGKFQKISRVFLDVVSQLPRASECWIRAEVPEAAKACPQLASPLPEISCVDFSCVKLLIVFRCFPWTPRACLDSSPEVSSLRLLDPSSAWGHAPWFHCPPLLTAV